MFTALAIKDGAEGTQTEGSWNLDPDGNKLKYEVEWLDFGALRLSKVDNTSEFQKNSKFRLIFFISGSSFSIFLIKASIPSTDTESVSSYS